MTSALLYDRLQFAFTATFHYLFPQLTMGLALLLLYLRSRVLLTGDEHYEEVADFWTKIFALNFGSYDRLLCMEGMREPAYADGRPGSSTCGIG